MFFKEEENIFDVYICKGKNSKECSLATILYNDDLPHFRLHVYKSMQQYSDSGVVQQLGVTCFAQRVFEKISKSYKSFIPHKILDAILIFLYNKRNPLSTPISKVNLQDKLLKRIYYDGNAYLLECLFSFVIKYKKDLLFWEFHDDKIYWKDFSEQLLILFYSPDYDTLKVLSILKKYDDLIRHKICLPIPETEFIKVYEIHLLSHLQLYNKKTVTEMFQGYGRYSDDRILQFFFEKNWINFESKNVEGNTPFLLFFKHGLFKFNGFDYYIDFFLKNKVDIYQHNHLGHTVSFYILQAQEDEFSSLPIHFIEKLKTFDLLCNVPTHISYPSWEIQKLVLVSHLKNDGDFQILPYEIIVQIFRYTKEQNNYYFQNIISHRIQYGAIRKCRECNVTNKKLMYCNKCYRVSYCSKKCQLKDWNLVHKIECKCFKNSIK